MERPCHVFVIAIRSNHVETAAIGFLANDGDFSTTSSSLRIRDEIEIQAGSDIIPRIVVEIPGYISSRSGKRKDVMAIKGE